MFALGTAHRVRVPEPQAALTRLADIDTIAAPWQELAADSSPVTGPDWALAWAQSYGPAYDLRLLTTSAGGQLTGVLPLVRRRGGPHRYEMLGAQDLFEPVDAVWADEDALTELVGKLAKLRAPFLLRRGLADSPFVQALGSPARHSVVVSMRASSGTPWLELDASWTEPDRHFDAGRRSDFRRAQRRAAAFGPVEFTVLQPTPAQVDALFADVVAVEGASWKAAAGSAMSVVPVMAAFYRRLAQLAAARGVLRLAFLHIDGEPAAVQLELVHASRLWLCKIGYDARFGRSSPGSLLMLHAIRHAAMEGLASVEFLGAQESWTSLWAPQVRRCVRVRRYAGVFALPVLAGEAVSWAAQRARDFGPHHVRPARHAALPGS